MRDRRLQGVQAVIQRQQGISAKRDDDGLVLDGQNGRTGVLRTGPKVVDRAPLLPLRHCLRVDPMALGKGSQALLTILYCSTDRRCRAGAAVSGAAV